MNLKMEKKNNASGAISDIVSAMKKNEPKKGVNLLMITKKLSAKKFGKKSSVC